VNSTTGQRLFCCNAQISQINQDLNPYLLVLQIMGNVRGLDELTTLRKGLSMSAIEQPADFRVAMTPLLNALRVNANFILELLHS
jgi:acyl-[acyl carrier protein]--UDP-N-acetylglucosamine O-acyltransferase